MLTIPTLDIGVTSRAFLQDHRRKSYLQPINWSVLSSGDTPYVEPMETDDNGGDPKPGGVYGTSSSHLIGGNHYNVSIYDRQLCFNIGRVMLKYKVYVELLLNICRDRFKYRVYIQTYFLIYSNVKVLLEYMHSNNVEI